MEKDLNTQIKLPFGGKEAITKVEEAGIEGEYIAIYSTYLKEFVYKKKGDLVLTYYRTCQDDELYNDIMSGTIRKDTLFNDGKATYAYNEENGDLDLLFKNSEEYVDVHTDDVFQEVYKQSEYYASKRTGDDARLYENLRATKYNNELLQTFFDQAAEMADLRLKDFARETFKMAGTCDGYYRAFVQPARRDEDMWKFAKNSLKSFFVHSVMSRWLDTCGADSNLYTDMAGADVDDVVTKLTYKVKPLMNTESVSIHVKGEVETEIKSKPFNNETTTKG